MKINFSKKTLISFVVTYVLSATSAFALLSAGASGELISPLSPSDSASTGTKASKLSINPDEPRSEACPLNGLKYTPTERKAWEKLRPANVMIENTVEARPQSGLSSADIIYEAVAEGGVTRFEAVFYCGAMANQGIVAPVRSARMHFVNLAAEYNTPIYVHVGGANCSAYQPGGPCTTNKKALAIEELFKLGWRHAGGNDFDTIGDTGKPVLYRDESRLGADVKLATEHTMTGDLEQIWKQAVKRGFADTMPKGESWLSGFKQWKFKDTADSNYGTTALQVNFEFWSGYKDFAVTWNFDSATGLYKRSEGGAPHTDLETKQQLTARTVIVQFTKENGPLDEHKHYVYDVIGSGKALIFQNGAVSEATWKKADQKSRTIFSEAGKEFVFNPGTIWVEIVAIGSKIDYK